MDIENRDTEQPTLTTAFRGWAVVEIMGHTRAAGFVTTEYYGNACLFRIDTPPLPEREFTLKEPDYVSHKYMPAGTKVQRPALQARSKLVGPSSIFSLNPCTEEVALQMIEEIYPRPLIVIGLPESAQIAGPKEDLKHAMGVDPVCGSEVEIVDSTQNREYGGITYVFCGQECRVEFEGDPRSYANGPYARDEQG